MAKGYQAHRRSFLPRMLTAHIEGNVIIRQIALATAVLASPILAAGQARAFDQAMADREAAVREHCGKLFHDETDYERCVARADRTADYNAFLDRDRTPLSADPFALTPPRSKSRQQVPRKRGTMSLATPGKKSASLSTIVFQKYCLS